MEKAIVLLGFPWDGEPKENQRIHLNRSFDTKIWQEEGISEMIGRVGDWGMGQQKMRMKIVELKQISKGCNVCR